MVARLYRPGGSQNDVQPTAAARRDRRRQSPVPLVLAQAGVSRSSGPLPSPICTTPARRINFSGRAPGGLTWLDDRHYVERHAGGPPMRVEATTGERAPLVDTRPPGGGGSRPCPTWPGARRGRVARQAGLVFNQRRTRRWSSSLADDLYHYDIEAERIDRLTETPAAETEVSFSPDGRFVAFVRDGNLVVTDTGGFREHELTDDGGGRIRNGQLDWVYQEEIYGRGNFRAYWWSPDSARIAYLQLDDQRRPDVHRPRPHPLPPRGRGVGLPQGGATRTRWCGSAWSDAEDAGGPTSWIDLAAYGADDPLVVDVGWTPDSERVVFQVQKPGADLARPQPGRPADRRRGYRASRDERGVGQRHRPTDLAARRDDADPERAHGGGSTCTHVDRTGTVLATRDERRVGGPRLHGVDEEAGIVYFSGTERSPIGLDVYRVGLDGTGLRRLSEREGTHTARFNPGLTHYLDRWSDISTPTQVRVHAADGSVVRVAAANPVRALDDYDLPRAEFLQVPNRDGFEMEALLIKPPDFDPTHRYPVYQHVYGGPHVQRVRNAWSAETLYWQLLAQHGVLVWLLDNSTASGKGAVSTWPVYQRFGELELRDLEDGLDWLTAQPWVDAGRIGIEGWSSTAGSW